MANIIDYDDRIRIDYDDRIRMVKAMEFIARHINDENIFEGWLMYGVADGDIDHGDLSDYISEDAAYWVEEDTLSELMQTFLECMHKCKVNGGLFCDGIVSGDSSRYEHEW